MSTHGGVIFYDVQRIEKIVALSLVAVKHVWICISCFMRAVSKALNKVSRLFLVISASKHNGAVVFYP